MSFHPEIVKELIDVLKPRKKLWILPILIFLIILGFLFIFVESTVVGPLIYTIF